MTGDPLVQGLEVGVVRGGGENRKLACVVMLPQFATQSRLDDRRSARSLTRGDQGVELLDHFAWEANRHLGRYPRRIPRLGCAMG